MLVERKDFNRREFVGKLFIIGAVATTGLLLASCGSDILSSGSQYYVVDANSCDGCGDCKKGCNHNAISISGGVATISDSRCAACGKCVRYCNNDAISVA
jgi:uncharacterized protein